MKWQSQQFNDDYVDDGDDDDELMMMCIDGEGDVLFSVVVFVVDLKLNWTEWLTEKSV